MQNILRLIVVGLIVFCQFSAKSQTHDVEKYPVFPSCEQASYENQQSCFKSTLVSTLVNTIKIPQVVLDDNYKGEIVILFEVTDQGKFKVIYIDTYYDELRTEVKRVFEELPEIKPATYNGKATYIQFKVPLKIPLEGNVLEETNDLANIAAIKEKKAVKEYDEVNNAKQPFGSLQYTSQLNIPFSHEVYSRFDDEMNRVGTNNHTAMKPFMYADVEPYYNMKAENDKLKYHYKSWFGKKFFDEHLVRFQTNDYWFAADVAADLQLGKDFDADFNTTYNNTRAAVVQGGLGKKFNFYAEIYESQGRFPQYFNDYAESIRPDGGNPAIIPGRGIAKDFKEDSYDYPVAEGYISYSPSKYFNFQFGHGKNFIGDGYRSLLLSDVASPYPYFKINTTFWKLKYTNTWMSLRDVRPEATVDGTFKTKYMANHYLSYNVSKRLNIGLFESVIWQNENGRGFDLNYLNPIIFYRAIEFSTGSRQGNSLIGLAYKYKFSDSFNFYGQLLIDEFSSVNIFSTNGSYKNKIGVQVGLKYFNAFKVKNLFFQLEYNQARPYTYSHNRIVLNYGHNNQSMAHLWGASFREFIAIARYKKNRLYGHMKFIYGERGFELTEDKQPYYGGDIYGDYYDYPTEYNNKIGQGNKAEFVYTELELGFLVNPTTNLKVYANIINRNLVPALRDTPFQFQEHTTWVNFGFRTDLFNWYYDF